MAREGQGISWGYAVTSTNVLVIRNWYLLLRALAASFFVLFIIVPYLILTMTLSKGDVSVTLVWFILFLFVGLYSVWCLCLEVLGVRITNNIITYAVRLGTDGALPLFRKTVRMAHVLDGSHKKIRKGMYVVYLSGEFGEAKILFDTKGGRDRLLAILRERFPDVKRFRWT